MMPVHHISKSMHHSCLQEGHDYGGSWNKQAQCCHGNKEAVARTCCWNKCCNLNAVQLKHEVISLLMLLVGLAGSTS
jgi:hypothetical protein